MQYITGLCDGAGAYADECVRAISGLFGLSLMFMTVIGLIVLIGLCARVCAALDRYRRRNDPPAYEDYKLASRVLDRIRNDVEGSYQISSSFESLVETYEPIDDIAGRRLRRCYDNYMEILRLATEADKLLDSVFVPNVKAT